MTVNNFVSFQTGLTNEQIERLEVALKGLTQAAATLTVSINLKGEYVYTITLNRGELTHEVALQFGIMIGAIQVGH